MSVSLEHYSTVTDDILPTWLRIYLSHLGKKPSTIGCLLEQILIITKQKQFFTALSVFVECCFMDCLSVHLGILSGFIINRGWLLVSQPAIQDPGRASQVGSRGVVLRGFNVLGNGNGFGSGEGSLQGPNIVLQLRV